MARHCRRERERDKQTDTHTHTERERERERESTLWYRSHLATVSSNEYG